jgi:hypothetical protein
MLTLTDLREMLAQMDRPLMSLYLHVDNARLENQSENPAWRIELKNEMRRLADSITTAEERATWDVIENRLQTFFATYQPASRSLVIFTDGEHFQQIDLPVPLTSQSGFGEPHVLPLLWVLDEYERYLIVQVDRENARFISAYLGTAQGAGEMQLEIDDYDFRQKRMMPAGNSTQASGGRDHDAYDATVDAHVKRFYRDVIERIRQLQQTLKSRRVIISGDEQAAHALAEQMSEAQRASVVGVAPAPLNLPEGEVLERVLETALAYERQYETELVQTIINDAHSGGRGAVGADDVIEALIQSRMEMLVLPYPPTDDGIANDLKARAFEAGVNIELVHGAPAAMLAREGGVCARLYYTLPETSM